MINGGEADPKRTDRVRLLSFVAARDNPKAVTELYRMLEEGRRRANYKGPIDTVPFGKEANRRCLELLIDYCVQQKLIGRTLAVEELY